uniref:Phospholipase A2 n=1 Tax=Macrostomum lignano TaxID=282301 RepID=A0A1I8IL93_9PLAT
MDKMFIWLIICIQLISVGYLQAATAGANNNDEALKDIFKSLLPKDFLEKQVAKDAKKNGKSIKTSGKAMQNLIHGFENVLESLSAPDNGNCVYKCPNGATPKAKPNHKVVPNGCGSHGFKPDVSAFPGLTDCCNKHDICYGTCGRGQAVCDRSFNACMADSCEQMRKSGAIKSDEALTECRATAAAFHLTVVSVGCQFLPRGPGQRLFRQFNEEQRAKEAAQPAPSIEDLLDNIDLSDSLFDLPEAVDHDEL